MINKRKNIFHLHKSKMHLHVYRKHENINYNKNIKKKMFNLFRHIKNDNCRLLLVNTRKIYSVSCRYQIL